MSEDSGEKVPLWIISFADMITLLLSFFVMLQTMAKSQDATLFGASQDSFRRAIAGYGIPDLLFGKKTVSDMDYKKLKYPTEEEPEFVRSARVVDADDDKIRRLFDDMSRQMEGRTAQASEKVLHMTPVAVSFTADGRSVDEAGKGLLGAYAANLQQTAQADEVRVYVVGLSADQKTPKEQWLVSARRATAAAAALQELLGASAPWQVRAWGSGSSRQVLQAVGNMTDKTSVLIIVMEGKSYGG